MTTNLLAVTNSGHLTEFLSAGTTPETGTTGEVLVCAAHGGHIEPGTAEQAVELTARLPRTTCWGCFGYDDSDAFDQWHTPSTAIRPENHPLLDRIADRQFETVISLHGLATDGMLVGGDIDRNIKQHVCSRLDDALAADVEAVAEGPYAGVSPHNFVNWLADGENGGLQLEQGPTVRDNEAETVIDVLEELIAENRL